MILNIDGEAILIDEEDYIHIPNRAWKFPKIKSKRYLRWQSSSKGKWYTVAFHRLVMNAPKGMQVDHINGDTRDNRKCNLRIVTATENNRNSSAWSSCESRYRGVSRCYGKWRAQIRVDYKQINLGRYESEIEAAYAYDLASLKYHGEYGRRNFLPLVW